MERNYYVMVVKVGNSAVMAYAPGVSVDIGDEVKLTNGNYGTVILTNIRWTEEDIEHHTKITGMTFNQVDLVFRRKEVDWNEPVSD